MLLVTNMFVWVMRVRGQDVPYMKTKWKNALRAKRKAEARYRQKKNGLELGGHTEV